MRLFCTGAGQGPGVEAEECETPSGCGYECNSRSGLRLLAAAHMSLLLSQQNPRFVQEMRLSTACQQRRLRYMSAALHFAAGDIISLAFLQGLGVLLHNSCHSPPKICQKSSSSCLTGGQRLGGRHACCHGLGQPSCDRGACAGVLSATSNLSAACPEVPAKCLPALPRTFRM